MSEDDAFFKVSGVEGCCYPHLKQTFETLFLGKKCKQQQLADYLQLDKAYVSRMVHGIVIPPLRVRLKVAEFFETDSVLIWRIPDIQSTDKREATWKG